jgi:peptidoglycan/LPS O-acetylase OafA/YrhL
MSDKVLSKEVAVFLYLVPFLGSAAYGMYLWVQSGISIYLPSTVFLTVTRDPYLFIVGSFAVILGMIVEVNSAGQADVQEGVKSAASALQSIAVASLVLAFLGAWYSNGLGNFSGAVTDFIVGRYSVIFPTLILLLSYFVTLRIKIDALQDPTVMGIIAMLLVPVAIYEVGKRDTPVGLAMAFVLVVVGIFLFVRISEKTQSLKQR